MDNVQSLTQLNPMLPVPSDSKADLHETYTDDTEELSFIHPSDKEKVSDSDAQEYSPFDNAVGRYLQRLGRTPLLTRQDEQELFLQFQDGKTFCINALRRCPRPVLKKAWKKIIEPTRARRGPKAARRPSLSSLTSRELEKLIAEVQCSLPLFEDDGEILQVGDTCLMEYELEQDSVGLLPELGLDEIFAQMDKGEELMHSARQRLVESNLLLVATVAKQFAFRNISLSFMDLMQEGSVGLMNAVEKFKVEKGHKFSTYAIWWIQQAIRRAMDGQNRTVRVPCYLTDDRRRIHHAKSELTQRLERAPSLDELAKEVNMPGNKVMDIIKSTQDIISLDTPLDDDLRSRRNIANLIPDERTLSPEEEMLEKSRKDVIEQVLSSLSEREAAVIKMRFGLDGNTPDTLSRIGKKLGVSRERIRQIEKEALMKLRHPDRSRLLRELL